MLRWSVRPGCSRSTALPFDESSSLGAPAAFGAYRVLHQIGSGVLGPVFRACDPDSDRLLAVKTFKLDLTPERVTQVADALRRLVATPPVHPALVPLVDAGVEGMTPFLVMGFEGGDTLDVVLRRVAPATLEQALPLLSRMAAAIDAAARAGVRHGALHPRDVFVDERVSVRMTGFGIVQALEAAGVPAPVLRRPYAAPERGTVSWDVRADVYSLGVIAHELVTGRRPLGRGDAEGAFAAGVGAAEQAELRRLLAAALSPNPDDRFTSATAFVAALERAADMQETRPHRETLDEAHETGFQETGSPQEARRPGRLVPPPVLPPPADEIASETDARTPGLLIHPRAGEIDTGTPDLDLPLAGRPLAASRPLITAPRARRRTPWGAALAAVLVGLAAGLVAGYYVFTLRHRAVPPIAAITGTDEAVTAPGASPAEATPPSGAAAVNEPPDPGVNAPGAVEPRPSRRPSDVERASAPRGRLVIRSTPDGAMVVVDGRLVGDTPVTVRDLTMGSHSVQVARPGYQPRSERVTLVPSAPSRLVEVALEPGADRAGATSGSGAVDIESMPRGARVSLDGRFVGQAPLRIAQVPPGVHLVALEMGGYHVETRQVRVDAGRSAPVRVLLQSVQ
jgi:hypothetical protein